MNHIDEHTRKLVEAEQQALALRHRGGDRRNELRLNHAPVKIAGGPHDGQELHQPSEVVEVELAAPDGVRHTYRRVTKGRTAADDVYEHVPPEDVKREKAAALKAQIAALQQQAKALQ